MSPVLRPLHGLEVVVGQYEGFAETDPTHDEANTKPAQPKTRLFMSVSSQAQKCANAMMRARRPHHNLA